MTPSADYLSSAKDFGLTVSKEPPGPEPVDYLSSAKEFGLTVSKTPPKGAPVDYISSAKQFGLEVTKEPPKRGRSSGEKWQQIGNPPILAEEPAQPTDGLTGFGTDVKNPRILAEERPKPRVLEDANGIYARQIPNAEIQGRESPAQMGRVGFINPQFNRPESSVPQLQPPSGAVPVLQNLPLVGRFLKNVPGVSSLKEDVRNIIPDAERASDELKDILFGPAYGTALKSDSMAEKVVNGILRGAAGLNTPEAVATWFAGSGLTAALPRILGSEKIAAALSAYPTISKGLDIASRNAVAGTFGVTGVVSGAIDTGTGFIEKNPEKIAQGAFELGLGGAALRHAARGGQETASAFPKPNEVVQGTPESRAQAEHFGVPEKPTEQQIAVARARVEELSAQGRNLAAQQWRNVAEYVKPIEIRLPDGTTGSIVPMQSGQIRSFNVVDAGGHTLVAGDAGTIGHWLRLHNIETPTVEQAGSAISLGGGGAAIHGEVPEASRPANVNQVGTPAGESIPREVAADMAASESSPVPARAAQPAITLRQPVQGTDGATYIPWSVQNGQVTASKRLSDGQRDMVQIPEDQFRALTQAAEGKEVVQEPVVQEPVTPPLPATQPEQPPAAAPPAVAPEPQSPAQIYMDRAQQLLVFHAGKGPRPAFLGAVGEPNATTPEEAAVYLKEKLANLGEHRAETPEMQMAQMLGAIAYQESGATAETKPAQPETKAPESETPVPEPSKPVAETTVKNRVPREDTLKPEIASTLAVGSTRVGPKGEVERLESVPLESVIQKKGQIYVPAAGDKPGFFYPRELVPEILAKYTAEPSPVAPEFRREPDGRMSIHDGQHRVAAALGRGEKSIQAWVPEKGEAGAQAMSPERVAAIHEGLKILSGFDQDYARELNGQGFGKFDVEIGHSLASARTLSPRQAEVGAKLVNKYRQQLPPDLVSRAGDPKRAIESAYVEEQALKAWAENRAYIDGQGNYHLKKEGSSSGPIAPWNKLIKAKYPTAKKLGQAAQKYKPGGAEPSPENLKERLAKVMAAQPVEVPEPKPVAAAGPIAPPDLASVESKLVASETDLTPEARDRIMQIFDRPEPAKPAPVVEPEPEPAPPAPTGNLEQIAARRPLNPSMADVEEMSKEGLTKEQQNGLTYQTGWRSFNDLHPGKEGTRILEAFDPVEWKWVPAGTYAAAADRSGYGGYGNYRAPELSSRADEKIIAEHPNVKPGPLSQDDLNEATKAFDAAAPGVTVAMPKSVQTGMEKMQKIFSGQPLWKFRQSTLKSASDQLAAWRKAYERSPEWEDLFNGTLSSVFHYGGNYNRDLQTQRAEEARLQTLADRMPDSPTMATVNKASTEGLLNEETLTAYRDGWRVVKYGYKGRQPTFSLQKFDPRSWTWETENAAHNAAKTKAMDEFKDYSKAEPLTEAALQKDVADVREILATRSKTKRTPEQIKAADNEQALPDRKPDMSKPFTYETSGDGVRYYLNFPNGEKWGPSSWQSNVFGRGNIVDAWDGPKLNEEEAKSYAVARWWDETLDKLRKQRTYSGPEYDATIQKLRDQAATIMAPTGRPSVLATREVDGFKREYQMQPSIRSNEHTGYEVMYKGPDGKWAADHYGYNGDANTYDDGIQKWLDREKEDISKYQFQDPVARSVADDLEKTAQLKMDMRAKPADAKKVERTGENDDLSQKASITLPNKTAKEIVQSLKRIAHSKPLPILGNVAIVTKGGKTKLFATDLETAVTYTLPAVSKGDSAITIPVAALDNALKGKSKDDLKIETGDNKAVLKLGTAESGAATMSIANYPELPVPTQHMADISAPTLARAIQATISAISTEESRFTLKGALLELSPEGSAMVSTDGHRLNVHKFDVPGVKEKQSILIPRYALEMIWRVFAKEQGPLTIKTDADHVAIENKDGSIQVLARKLTGNFPDYNRVLPDESKHTHKAVVNRKDLLDLMQRAIAMKERSNVVALSFRPDQVIAYKKTDDATVKGNAPATLTKIGEGEVGNPRVGMNAQYVADFLKSTDADKVEVSIPEPAGKDSKVADALVFRPVGEPNTTAVIMPMRDDAQDFDDGQASPLDKLKKLATEETGAVDISKIVAIVKKKFGDNVNYSGMGAAGDIFNRNLSQLKRANRTAHAAGIKASSYKGRTQAIMYATFPAMRAALKKHNSPYSREEVNLMQVESALIGKRERWEEMANHIASLPNDKVLDQFNSHSADLLDAIENKTRLPGNLSQIAAARAQEGDIAGLRDFLVDTFQAAADRVASLMPRADVDRMIADPGVQAALTVFFEKAAGPLSEQHAAHEGVFADAHGPTGIYYPLTPLGREQPGGTNRRMPFAKPRNMANFFATGLAGAYDPSPMAFRAKLLRAVRDGGKFEYLRTLEDAGLFYETDDRDDIFVDANGKEWPGVRETMAPSKTIIVPGKKPIHTKPRTGIMPAWLHSESRPILENKERPDPTNFLLGMIRTANAIAVQGVAEPIYHSVNIIGATVQNAPFMAAALAHGLEREGLSWTDYKGNVEKLVKVMNLRPTEAQFSRDLIEMSKYGIVPDRYGTMTYSKSEVEDIGAELKRFSLAPLLFGTRGIDIYARWMMFRTIKELNPNATPKEINEFVNQLGNYVPALAGKIEKFVKSVGLGPFYTAGLTMNKVGVNAWLGTGPVPKGGAAGAAYRLTKWMTVGAAGMLIYWALMHKWMTGKFPDKNSRMGEVEVSESVRRSKLGIARWGPGPEKGMVNVTAWNPLFLRGGRALGIPKGLEAYLQGSSEQVAEAISVSLLNAWSHPFMGPAPRAAVAGTLGVEPYMTGLRDQRGRFHPQFYRALPEKTGGLVSTTGWRAGAALKELNSFYHDVAVNTGLFPHNPDEKGDALVGLAGKLLLPNLLKPGYDAEKSSEYLTKQRAAMGDEE